MTGPFHLRLIALGLAVFVWSVLYAPLPAWTAELSARLTAVSEEKMVLPHDMVLTPDGKHLIVTDMGQSRVVVLDARTLALRAVIGADDAMSFPHDVAFNAQGQLLVADSGNDRILIYEMTGTEARLLNVWGNLNAVEGVVAGPAGQVYATLVEENLVVRLGDGEILAATGHALGMELDRPHDVAIVQDQYGTSVVATDPGNHRLIVFDEDLNPLYEISTWDPPFSEPKYIDIDAKGTFFVADQYNNRVRVLTSAAQSLGDLATGEVHLPEGVHVAGQRVWITDTERGRIVLYLMDESQ